MPGSNETVLAFCFGLLSAVAGATAHGAAPESRQVPAELWDRPRTGPIVMSVPAIREALAAMLESVQAKVTLRHAPEPEAAARAEELRAWLVAHAVEPARIVLRADLTARQPLRIEVER
jgi:hypothetical protein